jgi:peptidyl-prolyl cis-trans isomerase B (cyclophilin B)
MSVRKSMRVLIASSLVFCLSLDSASQSKEEYENIEAVLDTSRGQIIIEFFPKDAPQHVRYFIEQARAGTYDGTSFHRAIKYGLIQGGDPTTKSTSVKARAQYGTGGLNAGIPDEVNKNKHNPGAVSAVLAVDRANPNQVKPASSGSQFFIVLNAGEAKAQLDAKFTVFGRVVEGMDVVADISTLPTDRNHMLQERVELKRVILREKTPTVEQMKNMVATIETSFGNIKLQLLPESAPNTARAFIRYAKSGLYDGTTFFRVSQKYFLQAGYLQDWPQDSPNRKRFFSLWPIPVEKSEVKHVRGTASMFASQDGTTSWYFFIISQDNSGLDGKHVPFAKVVDGMDVVDKIAEVEVEGDKPKQRIEIKKITVW